MFNNDIINEVNEFIEEDMGTYERMKQIYILARKEYVKGKAIMLNDLFDEFEKKIRLVFVDKDDFTCKADPEIFTTRKEALPVYMPSLRKPGSDNDFMRFINVKIPCEKYLVMAKLDGASTLWLPNQAKLLSHGDGITGQNISHHIDHIKGLEGMNGFDVIIRGEIMIDKSSEFVKKAKGESRCVASGIINSDEPVPEANLKFVAYEIISPSDIPPIEQLEMLKDAGFEIPLHAIVDKENMTPTNMSRLFEEFEKSTETDYYYDGVVICSTEPRKSDYRPSLTSNLKEVELPADRFAWKKRLITESYQTKITRIEWNSVEGRLIPVLIYEPVIIGKTTYAKASGYNAKFIVDNQLGPGAVIEIVRSGDIIPNFFKTIEGVEVILPENSEWREGETKHIYEIEISDESKITALKKSLDALGVDGIGPATVEKMFKSGMDAVHRIYRATKDDFKKKLPGVAEKSSEKIYNGLRVNQANWTAREFMVASRLLPPLVSDSKLNLVFQIESDWTKWSFEELDSKRPKGLTSDTLFAIINIIPAFSKWYKKFVAVVGEPGNVSFETETRSTEKIPIAFTGCTADGLNIRKRLENAGYSISETVTKKCKYLFYSGTLKGSSKTKKAIEYGIEIRDINKFEF